MPREGQYVYAVIRADREEDFGSIGIGNSGGTVYSVVYNGIGVVISDSPVTQYSVTRANTMAHQKVMEMVMERYPMLPVRFGTVSEGMDAIRQKLLVERGKELADTLDYMGNKVELGVKAIYKDIKPVFEEIAETNKEIRRLRDRLAKRRGGVQREQVRLGEMVKNAFEAWKRHQEDAFLANFEGLWVERKLSASFGDQMIVNAAFLVQKEKETAFDEAVEKVVDQNSYKMTIKYVGPVPPCNFVEIVVKW